MLKNAKNLKQIDPVTVDGVPYEAYELQDIPAEEWNAIAEHEHSTGLMPVEFNSQRILTTQQLADNYETTARRISENFNRNQEYYAVGKHYYALSGEEKIDFINHTQIADGSKNAAVLYLWTERGALLHAKSLNTQKAWDVYDMLVDTYFRAQQLPAALPVDTLTARLDKLITMLERQYQAPAQPLQIEQKPTAKYDMQELKSKKMLTRKEAAFYISVCESTMHNIMHSVTFPALVRVGTGKGRVFVNREVFDEWIDTRTGGRPLPV